MDDFFFCAYCIAIPAFNTLIFSALAIEHHHVMILKLAFPVLP